MRYQAAKTAARTLAKIPGGDFGLDYFPGPGADNVLAVTAGVRELADDASQAAAKRLGEIGAIPTWNAIGGLGCPFATLTVFVPKRKKAGASDEIVRRIVNDSPHQGRRTENQAQGPLPGQFTKRSIRRKRFIHIRRGVA
jgi:hypothetical protein